MSGVDPAAMRIGPGRLVLVVGPSGAGKDTLIEAARAACRHDAGIVFPRRVITRPPSAAEDHDTISDTAFDQAAASGSFALRWAAHGLKYAIPAAIDDDIRAGHTVVCNVSRTIIGAVRERYLRVTVVLVTAPQDVLQARLEKRARSTDGAITGRVQRSVGAGDPAGPDLVIENTGSIESAAGALLRLIKTPRVDRAS